MAFNPKSRGALFRKLSASMTKVPQHKFKQMGSPPTPLSPPPVKSPETPKAPAAAAAVTPPKIPGVDENMVGKPQFTKFKKLKRMF